MQMEHTKLQAPSQNLISPLQHLSKSISFKIFPRICCILYSFAWIVNQCFPQVQVNRPIPETTISNLANSHEDTLLLLDLMRHKRQQEGQKKRVNLIPQSDIVEKYSFYSLQTFAIKP